MGTGCPARGPHGRQLTCAEGRRLLALGAHRGAPPAPPPAAPALLRARYVGAGGGGVSRTRPRVHRGARGALARRGPAEFGGPRRPAAGGGAGCGRRRGGEAGAGSQPGSRRGVPGPATQSRSGSGRRPPRRPRCVAAADGARGPLPPRRFLTPAPPPGFAVASGPPAAGSVRHYPTMPRGAGARRRPRPPAGSRGEARRRGLQCACACACTAPTSTPSRPRPLQPRPPRRAPPGMRLRRWVPTVSPRINPGNPARRLHRTPGFLCGSVPKPEEIRLRDFPSPLASGGSGAGVSLSIHIPL